MTAVERALARIAEARARAVAATPGPWQPYNPVRDDGDNECLDEWAISSLGDSDADWIAQEVQRQGDAAFIAHARIDVPALCAIAAAGLALREALDGPSHFGGDYTAWPDAVAAFDAALAAALGGDA